MTKIDANPDVDDAAELYRRFVAQNKRALKYSEDQPRVPAGQPGGGEFGSGEGGRLQHLDSGALMVGVDPSLQGRVRALGDTVGQGINLSGIDARTQEGVVRSLESFHENYPKVSVSVNALPQIIVASGVGAGGDIIYSKPLATTTAAGGGTSKIELNNEFFGDPARLGGTWEASLNTGFHPEGTGQGTGGSAKAIMDHELGHALGNYLPPGTEVNAWMKGYEAGGSPKTLEGEQALKSSISFYACQNVRECVAEAACAVGGSYPSPVARAIMGEMNAAYARLTEFA